MKVIVRVRVRPGAIFIAIRGCGTPLQWEAVVSSTMRGEQGLQGIPWGTERPTSLGAVLILKSSAGKAKSKICAKRENKWYLLIGLIVSLEI